MTDGLETIINAVPVAARLEQLAEEAAELGHAALKMARIIRGENPTPADFIDSLRRLREEYTDVAVAGSAAKLKIDRDVYDSKLARWAVRIEEARYSER